jgi:hypothetical protein
MKRSIKIVSIVLAAIVVLTVGIVLYDSGALVSTEQLQTEGFKQQSIPNSDIYEATFYSNNVKVADASVYIGPVTPQQGLASMQVYIEPGQGAGLTSSNTPTWMLDSFHLELAPARNGGLIRWYLETPEAPPWTHMVFQTSSEDPTSTIVGADNLGAIGGDPVSLAFYVEAYGATSFRFELNFTMHETGSLFTSQAGSAQIELPITLANAT